MYRPYAINRDSDGVNRCIRLKSYESHYSVDILAEHQLQPRLKEFSLVVIPDSSRLAEPFRQAVLDYVHQGGSLLLLGERCARLFGPALGVELDGQPQSVGAELAAGGGIVNLNGNWQAVKPTTARVVTSRYPTRDTRKSGQPAATLNTYGQGKVGAVYGPVALAFFRGHHPWLRQLIGQMARELFPAPAIVVSGPPCVDISLRRTQAGRLSVHLLNRSGAPVTNQHGIVDFIPRVGPVQLQIRMAARPARVIWAPEATELPATWDQGLLTVTVPVLHVHGVVVIE